MYLGFPWLPFIISISSICPGISIFQRVHSGAAAAFMTVGPNSWVGLCPVGLDPATFCIPSLLCVLVDHLRNIQLLEDGFRAIFFFLLTAWYQTAQWTFYLLNSHTDWFNKFKDVCDADFRTHVPMLTWSPILSHWYHHFCPGQFHFFSYVWFSLVNF